MPVNELSTHLVYGFVLAAEDLVKAGVVHATVRPANRALGMIKRRKAMGTLICADKNKKSIADLPLELFDPMEEHLHILCSDSMEDPFNWCTCCENDRHAEDYMPLSSYCRLTNGGKPVHGYPRWQCDQSNCSTEVHRKLQLEHRSDSHGSCDQCLADVVDILVDSRRQRYPRDLYTSLLQTYRMKIAWVEQRFGITVAVGLPLDLCYPSPEPTNTKTDTTKGSTKHTAIMDDARYPDASGVVVDPFVFSVDPALTARLEKFARLFNLRQQFRGNAIAKKTQPCWTLCLVEDT